MDGGVPEGVAAAATVRVDGAAFDGPTARIDHPDGSTPLDRAVVGIGRQVDNAIVVADSTASRRHAEIRRLGTDYLIVDRGSANGTKVNGDAVAERVLQDGDVITIGTTELRFLLQP